MKIKKIPNKIQFFIFLPVLICFSLSAAARDIEGFWEAYTFDGVSYTDSFPSAGYMDITNSPDLLCKSLGNGYSLPTIYQMSNQENGFIGKRKIGSLINEWGNLALNPGFVPYLSTVDENIFWVVGFSKQETVTDPEVITTTATSTIYTTVATTTKQRSVVDTIGNTYLRLVEKIIKKEIFEIDHVTNTRTTEGGVNTVLDFAKLLCVRPII